MAKKIIVIFTLIVLTICILIGGCSNPAEEELKTWKELVNILPKEKKRK